MRLYLNERVGKIHKYKINRDKENKNIEELKEELKIFF